MDDPPRVLSLCSGGLGLDLGYECATPGARVVCAVEREPFCIAYLAALMEAGCVEPFPVWDDIRSFDGGPWRGVVDCVTAGYPCQPFSLAGKRRGADDERHLWPEVARIIDECAPREVFLENVPGHVALGLPEVVSDLRRLGYRVPRPLLLEAGAVGASHKRERLFVYALRELADCAIGGLGIERDEGRPRRRGHADGGHQDLADTGLGFLPDAGRGPLGRDGAGPAGALLGDAQCPGARQGKQGEQGETRLGRDRLADAGEPPAVGLADGGSQRPQGEREAGPAPGTTGRGGGAVDRADRLRLRPCLHGITEDALPEVSDVPRCSGDLPLFAPGPADPRWPAIIRETPSLEPALRCMADGLAAARRGWLAMLGNSVVPLQAAFALRVLRARARIRWMSHDTPTQQSETTL